MGARAAPQLTLPLQGRVRARLAGRALALRQGVDGEIFRRIGEHRARGPARGARERSEAPERVFVAVFGVNGFAGAERDGAARDAHLLAREALDMHLVARTRAIVEGAMRE